MTATGITAGTAIINNASVISQHINVISIQNKDVMESNNLCHKEIKRQMERNKKKKDTTKNIHTAIMNMFQHAATTHKKQDRRHCPIMPAIHQL
jgi:hypothetical protein